MPECPALRYENIVSRVLEAKLPILCTIQVSLVGFDLAFDAARSHLNVLLPLLVAKSIHTIATKSIHTSWQPPRSGFKSETPKKTRVWARTDSAPQDPGTTACLTFGSAPVILVDGAVSRGDFAEEVVADSDPETADCMDSQRN